MGGSHQVARSKKDEFHSGIFVKDHKWRKAPVKESGENLFQEEETLISLIMKHKMVEIKKISWHWWVKLFIGEPNKYGKLLSIFQKQNISRIFLSHFAHLFCNSLDVFFFFCFSFLGDITFAESYINIFVFLSIFLIVYTHTHTDTVIFYLYKLFCL